MSDQQKSLLPIGERVTHFDGGPSSHGKGTIIAYNTRSKFSYLEEKFSEVTTAAIAAGLGNAVVESFYDKERCPYLVRWDSSAEYSQGYKDVYEPTSVRPFNPSENIFVQNGIAYPSGTILARRWCKGDNAWTNWQVMSPEDYEHHKDDSSFEFCHKP